MENLKHTEGPYFISDDKREKNEYGATGINIDGKLVTSLATVWYDAEKKGDEKEAEATAKLIAAAPELLEALQKFTDMYKKWHDSGDAGSWDLNEDEEYQSAISAIKKATEG